MKKAFTLIELLIVVAIIAILAAIAVPNFLEAQVRSKVSRVKSDQRSFATALESYYIDNNTYPPYWATGAASASANTVGVSVATGVSENVNSVRAATADQSNAKLIPTFAFNVNGIRGGLTTPVSFLTSYSSDVFGDIKTNTFGYVAVGSQWVMVSPGPAPAIANKVVMFPNGGSTSDITALFGTNGGATLPNSTLLVGKSSGTGNPAFTYDPTNGTSSNGDVWKLKG